MTHHCRTRFRNMLLLLLFIPTSLSIVISNPADLISQAADHDLEIIRERVIDDIMKPEVQKDRIIHVMNTINREGYWPEINYDDVSRTGFQHHQHLTNMLEMARAFRKKESDFFGTKELEKTIHSALDFWLAHDFLSDNWWWNEIGTPSRMIYFLLLMDDDLTDEQIKKGITIAGRANMDAGGARPGGDLIRIAGLWAKQGLFLRDSEVFEEAMEIIGADLKIGTGRGLKPDFGFHHRHDNVISTLTYGLHPPEQISSWAIRIKGTRFSFSEATMELLVDYYLDGICQSMAFGKYPDPGARNREISRMGALNPFSATIPDRMLLTSHHRTDELKSIAKIRNNEKKPDLRSTRFFWHSEYFTHQRPDWFASVRMYSERNNNMESPYNGEGLKNHHYADGSNFLTITAREYNQVFPIWNWQRIPGTTVVQKPRLPHHDEIVGKGLTSFVGAVTDDEYGAAVFDFESIHDPLKARKSWFFFDDEYVALGSGITSDADHPVNTTIAQRFLEQDVLTDHNHSISTLTMGEHDLDGISWVYHDKVAYIFPSSQHIRIKNTLSTGNWRRINHSHWATEDEISAELFTMWIDHGRNPENGSYEYIVVPGLKGSDVDNYRKNEPVTILSNTSALQAVRHNRLGISQVVFYEPGTITLEKDLDLSVDQPCIVMIKHAGDTVEKISVSDPARKHDVLELVITSQINARGNYWVAGWNREENSSRIIIDLPGHMWAGKSVVLDLK